MVFDVTNEESFHRVLSWLRDLKAHADPNVVICIAGNKCDKKPSFDISTCKEFAVSMGAKFIRTSALTGEGVDSVFEELSKSIVEVYRSKGRSSDRDNDALRLDVENKKNDSSLCC
jgi:GTPase SAR1 family protein